MKVYEWRNIKTGEVIDHDHWGEPPKKRGKWERVYRFGIGRVEGAANSPPRTSRKRGSS